MDEIYLLQGFRRYLNLYVRERFYLLLHVDDMLPIGSRSEVYMTKQQIISRWKIKDMSCEANCGLPNSKKSSS
jgi:hypothetical protein